MGLSSCGEAEETTSRSTATSEEELAAQLGTDTEPFDAGHNRNIDVGTLSAQAGPVLSDGQGRVVALAVAAAHRALATTPRKSSAQRRVDRGSLR